MEAKKTVVEIIRVVVKVGREDGRGETIAKEREGRLLKRLFFIKYFYTAE